MTVGKRSREFWRADARHFSKGKLAMVTEGTMSHRDLLAALVAPDWSVALQAVAAADTRIRGSMVGDPEIEEVVAQLVALASHTKWEVRRAVANAAAQAPHPIFETVLAKLALD